MPLQPGEAPPALPASARPVLRVFRAMYAKTGYHPPWVAYVAHRHGRTVGLCTFKGPPVGGLAEIAYFTLPSAEGRGIGTLMARALIRLARRRRTPPTLVAHTLPVENASTRILRKCGFAWSGERLDPEDGRVFRWELARPSRRP